MSLIGQLPASDRSYPSRSLVSIEWALGWLRGLNGYNPNLFWNLLTDIKCRTEFQPPHQSNELEPIILGGRLECREPVWKLVHEVSAAYAPQPGISESECAEWLQGLLMDTRKYLEAQALVRQFEEVIQEKGLVGSIRLTLDPEMSGEKGKELLETVLTALFPRMEEHVEKIAK